MLSWYPVVTCRDFSGRRWRGPFWWGSAPPLERLSPSSQHRKVAHNCMPLISLCTSVRLPCSLVRLPWHLLLIGFLPRGRIVYVLFSIYHSYSSLNTASHKSAYGHDIVLVVEGDVGHNFQNALRWKRLIWVTVKSESAYSLLCESQSSLVGRK